MKVTLKPPLWAAHLVSDLTDWWRSPLPVAELASFTLPDDVYFEYAYLDAQGEPKPDPDNPHPGMNPWWDYARSLFGPSYRPDPFAEVGSARPHGQLLRLSCRSQILQQERRYLVYSPAGQTEAALPLVLFQDGKAYYGWGKVPQVFDRLLGAGRVRPAHLLFVPPQERAREYAFNLQYRQFLVEELLPGAEARIQCDGERIAWGASLGGLLSAVLATENPDLFRTVVAQSGAFLFSPDQAVSRDPFHGGEWFLNEVIQGGSLQHDSPSLAQLHWYLDCGRLEWFQESNQRLVSALRTRGWPVEYRERNAGHNWVNWRNGLAPAFEFALGW